jgi:hypothetical protein
MNKINDHQAKTAVFDRSHEYFRNKDYIAAIAADYLMDREFPNCNEAVDEIMMVIRRIAQA